MKRKLYSLLVLSLLSGGMLSVAGTFQACGRAEAETVILKEQQGWVVDSLAPGLVWYNYTGYYEPQNANQIINVLDLDLSHPDYTIEVAYEGRDSLSAVAGRHGAVAGINGGYESEATFVKSNGVVHTRNELPEDHLRFWKHEGAIFYDRTDHRATIGYGTDEQYDASPAEDILSGAPMLIDNYDPVGERFTGNVDGLVLDSLEYEDYRRHQGVRHPRTAVALTADNHLLMITVDGRREQTAGMSAKELTLFIQRYFAPVSALNVDGGGSTTMWIAGQNMDENGVVNYPTDNVRFDHYGQRSVRSFLLVKRR